MDDPIPNELDNALSLLIPAVMACGNPGSPMYLDLKVFEQTAQAAGCWSGLLPDKRGRRVLDERVAGEVEVAFRHCMHEAATAMADRVSGSGGGSGGSGCGGVGGGGGGGGGLIMPKRPPSGGDPSEALEASMPLGLLSLALEFVSTEVAASERSVGSALTGLPMVLLEDFLESQGRETCKEFWSMWVEPNAERLTTPSMMQGGRYTLIRLCKKLAQRMSKTHDSSFCGQIHLFLSKALGFFERSGLNVTGGVNFDNVTAFEGEEQFRKAMWGFDGEEEASSARAATGSGGRGDSMDVDSGERKDAQQQQQQEFAVDYLLYQSFWRLQEYALKPDAAVKGDKAKDTWKAILHDVDKILGAFEANAFSEHDLRLARAKWTSAFSSSSSTSSNPSISSSTVGGMSGKGKRKRGVGVGMDVEELEDGAEACGRRGQGGGGYFGLKYLTSSRLLRLQLRDPTLRLQVLTQWLILAASLKSKVGKDRDSPNSAVDLNPRMERAKELVKATPPRGEEYLGMLETVLHRESAWTKWKDVDKCNIIEPVADAEAKALEAAASAALGAPKSKKYRLLPSSEGVERARRERASYAPLGPDFNLERLVNKLHDAVPSAEKHLEDQRMCAADPEVDPSELPSANPLYTWRALRLLSAEDPVNLAGCYDGDLVKVMACLDARKAKAKARGEATKAKSPAAATAAAPSANPAASSATPAPVSGSAAAPVHPAGASLNESRTSSSTGASEASFPQAAAVPVSRALGPGPAPASSPGPMPARAAAPAPTPVPSPMPLKETAATPPSKRPLKGDTMRGVAASAVDARGSVPPAKSQAEGVSARTAIVVDGEDGEEEEGIQEAGEKKGGKNDDAATRSGREASRANGEVEGESNRDVSAQSAVKRNAPKRPGSPGVPAASPPGVSPASAGKSPNRAAAAGRAAEATGDDPKTPTKVRKGPAPAVASPPRKTTSSPPPTLMGWMAPAAGPPSGAAVISKGEGTDGGKANNGVKRDVDNGSGKANANGDAEGVAEPVKVPTPALASAPAVAMSPNSRMTRRRSKSLGKDGGEGSK